MKGRNRALITLKKPMTDTLQKIRDLQFSDKPTAEALLITFLRQNTPFDVLHVELTPKAISLNSFNGFMTLRDNTRYFFKTHTESNTVIDEYYNAELLANAGYPIIQPIYKSTEPGKQILIYEVIPDKSVFDIAWDIENGDDTHFAALTEAQHKADDDLLFLYRRTHRIKKYEQVDSSPIHQLFYHRLVGGRLDNFYGALSGDKHKFFHLPHGQVSTAEVRRVRWVINGQVYHETLNHIILRAIDQLRPKDNQQETIIGHGDAHNGNVFFRADEHSLLYFDPAFAGEHHPLLDLTKPLFHNVFAMWMYFPQEMQTKTQISLEIKDDTWYVNYVYPLHPVRQMFLESKINRVLAPYLAANYTKDDWRIFLKSALFCCPFLTMNLADNERFPPEISLLGLAMSIEMGAESHEKRSLIDKILDDVELPKTS